MSRPARPKKEVTMVKEKILGKALNILVDEGFDNLTMSKIGKHMGMTSANIYNYYQNEDELYNAIIIKGYNYLYDTLKKATDDATGPYDRIMELIRSYLNFGIANPHYYHLMFTMSSPKYQDYVGTPVEAIAYTEKENSMRVIRYATFIIDEYVNSHPGFDGVDSYLFTMQLWSQLHGLISLNYSGNLSEADENTEQIIAGVIGNIEIIMKRGLN